MKTLRKKYTETEIETLCEALKRNEISFRWLLENNCKELAALSDVLAYGNAEARDWLKQHAFNALLAFIDALAGDESAYGYLTTGHSKEWAAVRDILAGSDDAEDWLLKFKFDQYLQLGQTLKMLATSGTGGGGSGGFSGSGGSGGGGGFGGFGGGSFSGGGGAGSW